jgi:hypothetical protein
MNMQDVDGLNRLPKWIPGNESDAEYKKSTQQAQSYIETNIEEVRS